MPSLSSAIERSANLGMSLGWIAISPASILRVKSTSFSIQNTASFRIRSWRTLLFRFSDLSLFAASAGHPPTSLGQGMGMKLFLPSYLSRCRSNFSCFKSATSSSRSFGMAPLRRQAWFPQGEERSGSPLGLSTCAAHDHLSSDHVRVRPVAPGV
jgi:hypothetical protein